MDLDRFQTCSASTTVSGPDTIWYIFRQAEVLVDVRGPTPALPQGPLGLAPEAPPLHLGQLDGRRAYASLAAETFQPEAGWEFVPLRSLFGRLEPGEFSLAGRALHLLEWDLNARFCGRCGGATLASTSERARACERCGRVHHPRISPAVIGIVEREGRVLLARHVRSARPVYTALAGFVEPGESLEEAFSREVLEEVGLRIRDVRYFGSQPWAFSHSLMVGFTAQYASGEVKPEPAEIQDARWFAPDDLPDLPGKLSIARSLIDDFVRRHPRGRAAPAS